MVIGVRGIVASATTAVVVWGSGHLRRRTHWRLRPPWRRPRSRPAPPSSPDGRPRDGPASTPASSPRPRAAGACTANFVFTQGDRVFLGQAAHCAGTGEATETDGCSSATRPLGTEVTIHGSDGRDRTGGMVYSSWVAMQADDETDPDVCAYNDFALVELSSGDAADVNPSMPFFGGPTGVHEGTLQAGSAVLGYGNSTTRLGTEALRPKAGSVVSSPAGASATRCTRSAPASPATPAAATSTERRRGRRGALDAEPRAAAGQQRHDEPAEGAGGTRRPRVRRPPARARHRAVHPEPGGAPAAFAGSRPVRSRRRGRACR